MTEMRKPIKINQGRMAYYAAKVREVQEQRTIVGRLAIRCGLGGASHGWRVEMSVLHPVDRKTVEVQGYKAACAELRYAI